MSSSRVKSEPKTGYTRLETDEELTVRVRLLAGQNAHRSHTTSVDDWAGAHGLQRRIVEGT